MKDTKKTKNQLIDELNELPMAKAHEKLYESENFSEIRFCGLILNELLTNAFKYASTEREKGQIFISLKALSENENFLIIKDDGIGLPETIDIENPETLGLQLVQDLIVQINGTISITRNNGTEFYINFPGTNNE